MDFIKKLKEHWKNKKFLCIGLDPDLERLPKHVRSKNLAETFFAFSKAIIDETKDIVCAYKPNAAFYEAFGIDGLLALKQTIEYIHSIDSGIPVILDAKRGDIGSTNKGYAIASFDYLQSDAMTIQSYLGKEACDEFLKRKDKGVIILVKTSNKGSAEFQDIVVNDMPLYMKVARNIAKDWNTNSNCGIVVGATYPDELKKIREEVGDMPILIPGIGAQGGDLESSVRFGKNSHNEGIIISTSRAILYASNGRDFAKQAKNAARNIDEQIKKFV